MKWFLRILAVFFLLTVAAAAVYLLPPHWQIRQVNTPLPDADALYELANVSDGPVRLSYITTSSLPVIGGEMANVSILIEWQDGRLFIIDVGMDRATASEFAEQINAMGMGTGPASINGSIDELLGTDIQRISGIGFTHLHSDHTQALDRFCKTYGKPLTGIQTQQQASLHNLHTQAAAQQIETSCIEPQVILADQFTPLQAFPGVGIYNLGGHTPGSTLWAIALDEQVFLFSGDITNSMQDLHHNRGKGFLYSVLLVPEDTARTEQLRHYLKTLHNDERFTVIVAHDHEQIKTTLPPFYIDQVSSN